MKIRWTHGDLNLAPKLSPVLMSGPKLRGKLETLYQFLWDWEAEAAVAGETEYLRKGNGWRLQQTLEIQLTLISSYLKTQIPKARERRNTKSQILKLWSFMQD